jgi:hypothetical protein
LAGKPRRFDPAQLLDARSLPFFAAQYLFSRRLVLLRYTLP